MPRIRGMHDLRGATSPEALKALMEDAELRAQIGRPGGLFEIITKVLPDLDAEEVGWLGAIPAAQVEAIRAVIESVATSDGLELEIQYEPAYDFSLNVYEYDKCVVIWVNGPFPGQAFPREAFKSG